MGLHQKASQTVQRFGIDAETRIAKLMVKRLETQKNTVSVELGGAYREVPNITQVHLDTFWTEEQLDEWLCRVKDMDFAGIYVRDEDNAAIAARS